MRQPDIAQQPVRKRIKNFHEVSLGLSKKQALDEAQRCPQCAHPQCVQGCPLQIDIPGFIRAIREGDFVKALQRIREQNSLSGFCGRLCSAPCETACILNQETESQPIAIKALERFAFDYGQSKTRQLFNAQRSNSTHQKVAVVGSGPSGLMTAADLMENGHQVRIFEAFDKPGGFARYGALEFRFPKKVLEQDIQYVQSLGVEIQTLAPFGPGYRIEELLQEGYRAVVLATGGNIPLPTELWHQEVFGVYMAQEFLLRVSYCQSHFGLKPREPFALGEKVLVIGADGIALDCARALIRFGKQVTLVHPYTDQDINAPRLEVQQAQEEGVRMESLAKPLQCIVDDHQRCQGIQCLRLDFAQVADSQEWKIIPVQNSEFTIKADSVIISPQTKANTLLAQWTPGLKVDRTGNFFYKKNDHQTSIPGVFAAGSAAVGPVSFIEALYDSKIVAVKIDQYLRS